MASDDPLSAALAEAESLMETLGTTASSDGATTPVLNLSVDSSDINGAFSIDDDDEDDKAVKPSADNTANQQNLHPLHDMFLDNKGGGGNPPQQQNAVPPGSTATTGSTPTPPMQPGVTLQQQPGMMMMSPEVPQQPQQPGMHPQQQASASWMNPTSLWSTSAAATTNSATSGWSPSTASSSNSWKDSTSRFLSSVTAAVSTTAAAPGTPGTTFIGGTSATSPVPPSTPVLATTTTAPPAPSPHFMAAAAAPPTLSSTLDKEQTQRLVERALGEPLLKAEGVIMFLSHLLHVSSSSNKVDYNYQRDDDTNAAIWCCAMTYYRIIVFRTTTEQVEEIVADTTSTTASGDDDEKEPEDIAPVKPSSSGNNLEDVQLSKSKDDEAKLSAAVSATTTTTKAIHPCPNYWHPSCWPPSSQRETFLFQIPLASLDKVEKNITASAALPTSTLLSILVTAKPDHRFLRWTPRAYADALRAHELLQTYAFPGKNQLGYLFAFESQRDVVVQQQKQQTTTCNDQPPKELSPARYEAVQEMARQIQVGKDRWKQLLHQQAKNGGGVIATSKEANPAEYDEPPTMPWKIWTNVNSQFELCASYPPILIGPPLEERYHVTETPAIIQQCARFRSEQRLPVLTWTSGIDGASIWRSSQPRLGLQGNRSAGDEVYLQQIQYAAAQCTSECQRLLLLHQQQQGTSGSGTTTQQSPSPSAILSPLMQSRKLLQLYTGCNNLQPWLVEPPTPAPPVQVSTAAANSLANTATPMPPLKILDVRPRSAAMANRTNGYGYEPATHYPGTSLQWCNIGNIHAVREAHTKLHSVLQQPTVSSSEHLLNYNTAIEDSKWLYWIRVIWSAAWQTVYWAHVQRLPVLVHCSHGWDRTSQVAALAQILLDPYYRTVAGLAVLIEKDFLSFGHPFHTRCGHGESSSTSSNAAGRDEGQISPIFLQFLDCVYQIVTLYPEAFEYTPQYLLEIANHIYSCRFGTFLCDTERERVVLAGLRQRTLSLWDSLDEDSSLKNPTFDTTKELESNTVLFMPLPTLLRNISLWTELHCPFASAGTMRWKPNVLSNEVAVVPSRNEETDQSKNFSIE